MKFRKKTTATILIAIFMISVFAVVMPVSAAEDELAVDRYSSGMVWEETYATIQAAITGASSGDIIIVDAGLYAEDLDIPDTLTGLELKSAEDGVTIKGVANRPEGEFPNVTPNIDIWADEVKVHGFTIEGPDYVALYYSSGICIGGADVEIYDNDFKATGAETLDELSQAIQTYAGPYDISGLNIHDNTFTALADSTAGYEAIYVNRDTGEGTITIEDNTFTGKVFRAITTERSNTDIIDNTIITDLPPGGFGAGKGYVGILVRYAAASQTLVDVVGNTISGSGTGKGFTWGIYIGTGTQALTGIVLTGNTIEDNDIGIRVRSSADGVTVNYNDILDNVDGVVNEDSANVLDATYNWWGSPTGPTHTLNPSGVGDTVSDDVDYVPWISESTLGMTSVIEPATYDLTLTIVGSGSVTILTVEYFEGVNVITLDNSEPAPVYTLTALPDTYWKLEGWSTPPGGSDLVETITLNDDMSVTATFVPKVVSLELSTYDINFGTVVAGDPSVIIPVTVTNDGELVVDVSMSLSADTGTFYADYLTINTQPMASWPTISALGIEASTGVNLQLIVSSEFVPSPSAYTGTLVFEATPLPPP